MSHVPHVFATDPWAADRIVLGESTVRHLRAVLRLRDGAAVTYTNGAGTIGAGLLAGDAVTRGEEHAASRPAPALVLAVAAPTRNERARFLVEKCAELGVDRMLWLDTRYGQGRPPSSAKCEAWAVAALEQSRGAWLMEVGTAPSVATLLDEPERSVWVADPDGGPWPDDPADEVVLCIGPEGGWAPGEVPAEQPRIVLGGRVLRVETAALVGAALALDRLGRMR